MSSPTHIAFNDIVQSLDQFKERKAIIDKDGTAYSYADFKKLIVGARTHLEGLGVKKGDKILVFVPMSTQLYAILEAIFSLGATAIFLDPWMKGKKMGNVIKQVQPDLFVVTKKINRIAWLLPATWSLKKWKVDQITPSNHDWEIVDVDGSDNALITFTSGTSGTPKGANRTFDFLHAQAETLKGHLANDQNEGFIDFTNFPIVGLADFAVGNTVVIPQINLMKIHKADSHALKNHLNQNMVSRLIVSPSLLSKIIEDATTEQLQHIKHVVTGGAPIPMHLILNCLEYFPDVFFEAIYGSTESEPICITDFKVVKERLSEPLKGVYVGEVVPEIQLKIIEAHKAAIGSDQFAQMQLSEGKIGEVVVTGNHVNKNYYKNPAAFQQAKIVDIEGEIWHRTGDLGYLENGHLFLVGRDHRIIQRDNTAYYPYGLEQHIQLKFNVKDVGYIQKDDRILFYVSDKSDTTAIYNEIKAVGYPIDAVVQTTKPLPRDARHKSKLQVEQL